MQLVTWNVNSLKARLPRVLELLGWLGPDVVCLQETKATAEAFPRDELAAAGYAAAEHSAGRWAGVAILAREGLALEDVHAGLVGETAPEEARWVQARVDGVRIASVYVPNGRAVASEHFAAKLVFLEAMAAAAGDLDVIAGDLNVCRADEDVYDPAAFAGATHVTRDERERLEAVIEAGPMLDAHRERHPGERVFTWWDYRAGHFHKGLGLRIDYVLLGPAVAPRLRGCAIARDFRKGTKPSDHAPLVCELDG